MMTKRKPRNLGLHRKTKNGPRVLRCDVYVEVTQVTRSRWHYPAYGFICPVYGCEWEDGPTDPYGRCCSRQCSEYERALAGRHKGRNRRMPIDADVLLMIQAEAHSQGMQDSPVIRAATELTWKRAHALPDVVDKRTGGLRPERELAADSGFVRKVSTPRARDAVGRPVFYGSTNE